MYFFVSWQLSKQFLTKLNVAQTHSLAILNCTVRKTTRKRLSNASLF